ncbi:RNB domain-containing ribonuclease, partial [Moraxella sp.]|uniref:RNB domain-containing ribonuclease n=1 Tax=Moraxella sp. TaxID=479 RepID=UPI002617FFD8
HKLIEEMMLLANTCGANFALKHELPALYRNHDKPSDEKSAKLSEYVKSFGLSFPTESPTHADYQHIIKATEGRADTESIHSMLLRSMMQANYSPDNIGHFGLAYDEYSHFTSPIRRYPDLMLHRAIKDKVTNTKPKATIYKTLDEAGEQTSTTERRAEEASRHVETWLKCHYMGRHLGDEFVGTITTVTSFGLFITLNDLFIDGLIHISNLSAEYYEYNEREQALIGEKGSTFKLGEQLLIKVAGVNMDLLQVDFALVEKIEDSTQTNKKPTKRKK